MSDAVHVSRRFGFTLPLIVYAFAAIWITWPIVTQLSTHGLGAGYGDQFENVRMSWWAQYALQHGYSPFYQSLLGYPNGFFSATQWSEPLTYLPAALLAFIVGPLVGYNLWILIELTLTGLAAFVLCRGVLGGEKAIDRLAALIGGLIFMAYPTVQGHVSGGHIGILTLYAFPLYTLCLWRVVAQGAGWRTALGGALALWITAIGNIDLMVFTLFPTALFLLGWNAIFDRKTFWRKKILGNLAILFGVGGLLLILFFAPLFAQLTAPVKTADLQESGWVTFSADPLSFVSPSPFTPWGASLAPGFSRTVLGTNTVEGTAYVGVFTAILCAVALIVKPSPPAPLPHTGEGRNNPFIDSVGEQTGNGKSLYRALGQGFRVREWLVIALGSAILSLGPFLKWHDQPVVYTLGTYQSYITLPWAFLQNLPVLNATRTPGRFNLTVGLALAVIAAFGVRLIFGRLSRRNVQLALTVFLAVGILVDYQLFFPALTTPAAIPSYFYQLANRSDVHAVFDLPWDNLLASKDAIYFQTAHQKPLIAGHVVRQTPVDPNKLTLLQSAILGQLQPGVTADSPPNVRALLNQMGADVIVLHLEYVPDSSAQIATVTRLLGTPVYKDNRVAVFNVPHESTPFDSNTLIQTARQNNGTITYIYVPDTANSCRTVQLSLSPGVSDPLTLDVDDSMVSIASPHQPTNTWTLWLPPGFHKLTTNLATRDVSIDSAQAQAQNINSAAFGMGLSLHCGQITQTADSLQIRLAWHAEQKLNGDYHLFVHLLDEQGHIAAQYDGPPGNGTFPTTQWQAGQDWSESIALSLQGIPPGEHHLEAGWYSYPAMVRLPVLDNSPGATNGLLSLGSVIVPEVMSF